MMGNERQPWERQTWETSGAFSAFRLYLAQTPPRSIDAAFRSWRAQRGFKEDSSAGKKPARASGCWRNWSLGRHSHGEKIEGAQSWTVRAAAWDQHLIDQATEAAEAAWRGKAMGKAEVIGRMSEHGRNDMKAFYKITERWTESPLPTEEIIREEKFTKIVRKQTVECTRYLVRKVVLDLERLLDPELSFRVKKFSDSPKNGLSIELYDAPAAVVRIGQHLGLFTDQSTNLNIDLSQLSNEQLERVANGEDVLIVLATPGKGGAGAAEA